MDANGPEIIGTELKYLAARLLPYLKNSTFHRVESGPFGATFRSSRILSLRRKRCPVSSSTAVSTDRYRSTSPLYLWREANRYEHARHRSSAGTTERTATKTHPELPPRRPFYPVRRHSQSSTLSFPWKSRRAADASHLRASPRKRSISARKHGRINRATFQRLRGLSIEL